MKTKRRPNLLPASALTGVCLGLSVSESPDLLRLGLTETHFRLALAEIARCVLVSGGNLAYGGHLQPAGYTNFLTHELERYSRRDRPLKIYLAWTEHRKLPLSALRAEKDNLGLYGSIVHLDRDGNEVAVDYQRGENPQLTFEVETTRRSLTGLRQYMAHHTQGRVLIGGKRTGFQGEMPGLLEEALYALEAGQPLYLAGGFGGITHDIAMRLGVDDGKWIPRLSAAKDECVDRGIERLLETMRKTGGASFDNGLSPAEMQRLAACHRPSEIATLVSLGLGRRFSRGDARA